MERLAGVAVTSPVGVDLGSPESWPRRRHFGHRTAMPMPETSMHQNHSAINAKHQVGSSWQIFEVESKSETAGMKPSPQDQLWPRIPAADAAHVEPPLFGCEDVCQDPITPQLR
jgi:hypothetical protein